MNYAKAKTEQELLDMVAHLESKGYEKDIDCMSLDNMAEFLYHPVVGINHEGKIFNAEHGLAMQGHEISVEDFLKQ